MYKMMFKYWHNEKTWCETTLHGATKEDVYESARQWSLKASPEKEGHFTISALWHMEPKKCMSGFHMKKVGC